MDAETRLFFASASTDRSDDLVPLRCPWVCCDLSRTSRLGSLPILRREYRSQLENQSPPILVHDHGVWLALNHVVASECHRAEISRIVSPRGMLLPWSMNHRRSKKQVAWALYQRKDLFRARAFHATSAEEAHELRKLGFTQPVAIIPNGVNLPDFIPTTSPYRTHRTVLFLSRIHGKKNLLGFLTAWAKVRPSNEWRFVIAGPDEQGHANLVRNAAHKLGIQKQIDIVGPVDDNAKWQMYADADVTVLPTFSENFGITVAESLCVGTPVITTTGTPWRELNEQGIGWWVSSEPQSLAEALSDAITRSDATLFEMGRRGQHWAMRMFAWKSVARRMTHFYDWIAQGCPTTDGNIAFVDSSADVNDVSPFGGAVQTTLLE